MQFIKPAPNRPGKVQVAIEDAGQMKGAVPAPLEEARPAASDSGVMGPAGAITPTVSPAHKAGGRMRSLYAGKGIRKGHLN